MNSPKAAGGGWKVPRPIFFCDSGRRRSQSPRMLTTNSSSFTAQRPPGTREERDKAKIRKGRVENAVKKKEKKTGSVIHVFGEQDTKKKKGEKNCAEKQ